MIFRLVVLSDHAEFLDGVQGEWIAPTLILARYAAVADGEGSEIAPMLRRFAAERAREAAYEYARASAA